MSRNVFDGPAPRIIYYYQTLTDLEPIIKNARGHTTHVFLSAFHFGYEPDTQHPDRPSSAPRLGYIHLNDHSPSDPRYDAVWTQLEKLHSTWCEIGIMLGGAGGAFEKLFVDYETFYPLLRSFLQTHAYLIHHINLDVEEHISVQNVQRLVKSLRADFPTLGISLAPVLNEVLNPCEPGSFSGFAYQELWDTLGDHFEFINVQMYNGSFTKENYAKRGCLCVGIF
jgi:hypothetical protein